MALAALLALAAGALTLAALSGPVAPLALGVLGAALAGLAVTLTMLYGRLRSVHEEASAGAARPTPVLNIPGPCPSEASLERDRSKGSHTGNAANSGGNSPGSRTASAESAERLAQKTRSLQILYDVAASVNTARDLDDLLTRFLYTLIELVDARAGVVRLLTPDQCLRLVASVGVPEDVREREMLVPVDECMCGAAVQGDDLVIDRDQTACRAYLGGPLRRECVSTIIAVPLQYRDSKLGLYNLFLDQEVMLSEDLKELLVSIGRHLGMAIEKAQLDEKAQRLSIVQERTMLAHELHDSVAQTIASLRYRVRALQEILPENDSPVAARELKQIRASLDEAHMELRQLMVHYRAPMDERGLLPAIEDLMERFRRETDVALYVQKECGGSNLPPLLEMQVLRIIQEALANVRKHSGAKAVRVLMRCEDGEFYRVLIEDDGVGFGDVGPVGNPGEHMGLGIMRERAKRLRGELRIESEPGEGTRVELTFRHRATPSTPDSQSELCEIHESSDH